MGRKPLSKPAEYTLYAHSVCKITYHTVLVVKYRRQIIVPEIMQDLAQYVKYLIEYCYQGRLVEFNGEADHIHVLFEVPPTLAPSKIICNLKTQTSKFVRRKYGNHIQKDLWKDSFWSDSYFLTTTGGASIEVLEKYIQQQGVERPKRKYAKRKGKKQCAFCI